MPTAEATLDTNRSPSGSPAAEGWYDPDSVVFQCAEDDRLESLVLRRSGEDHIPTADLARIGSPTDTRRATSLALTRP